MTAEERLELARARGMATAALLCLQQLCRVIHEAGLLSTEQLRDAISEALATAETSERTRPLDVEIGRTAAQAIRQAFEAR